MKNQIISKVILLNKNLTKHRLKRKNISIDA